MCKSVCAGLAPDLHEEELLCYLLNQLLRHVLREKLGPELKLQRVLLLHIL